MSLLIFKFWLRRFLWIGGIASGALLLIEIGSNFASPDFAGAILWGLTAGVVAATSSTWWARYKGCGLPPAGSRS